MRVKTHSCLVKLFYCTILIGSIPFFVFACSLIARNANILPLIIVAAALGLLYLMLMILPVPCGTPGCDGWMKKSITEDSTWGLIIKSKLEYRCPRCNSVYQDYIFHLPQGDWIP